MNKAARTLMAVVALGCGPRAEDVPLLRSDHCPVGGCSDGGIAFDGGPTTIPPEPLEPWDETGAGLLTGIFAVETVITARVVIPIETRQLFRLRIVQRGKELQQKVTLCAFKLPSVEGVAELGIPPALEAVMQQKAVENTGAFLSTDAVLGAKYDPPASLIVVGANLADPKSKLPSAESPAGQVDEDEDGNPGVTILAKALTCKTPQALYVALRTSAKLVGTVKSFDRMEGSADVTLDQSVLGYSDECMAAAAKLNIQVDPGSPFRAERVSDADDLDQNGNVSCAEIKLRAPERFGEFWSTPSAL